MLVRVATPFSSTRYTPPASLTIIWPVVRMNWICHGSNCTSGPVDTRVTWASEPSRSTSREFGLQVMGTRMNSSVPARWITWPTPPSTATSTGGTSARASVTLLLL